ncbi:MAG: hypothetical protein V3U59_09185 [Gammaproteobacteria bacterium]
MNAAADTRRVLTTRDEVLSMAVEIADLAHRSLAIFSHALDPAVYDQPRFLDTVKRLALVRINARVRVVIVDVGRAAQYNQRFLTLGQRLPSIVEFRRVGEKHREHEETFIVADATALIFQPSRESWDAIADTNAPAIAKKHLTAFDEMWEQSVPDPNLQRLSV